VLSDSIYLIDPATGAMRAVVTGLNDFQSGYATWSPDHRLLAFGDSGLHLLDPATGHDRTLINGQGLSMPAWSGDGRQLVYGDGSNLWITPMQRARPVELPIPPSLAPLAMTWRPADVIAFDGLELDCSQPGACLSTDRGDIWSIQKDGSRLHQLTHFGHAEAPKWSPDRTKLLFIHRFVSKNPRTELWVAKSSGAAAKRLLAYPDVIAGAWSATGDRIAMVRSDAQSDTMQVWVSNADGSDAHPVGTPVDGTDATIDW
jgi:Tol biopolymer transport system component